MELWTIDIPFDTLLLKYWPQENLNTLITSLSSLNSESEIAEALSPVGFKRADYYEAGIVSRIIKMFCEAQSLCTKNKHCQDVYRHSIGMKCCTAAAIRKRLHPKFMRHLGVFSNFDFQKSVITKLSISVVRNKLGVLLIHCPHTNNNNTIENICDLSTSDTAQLLNNNHTPYQHTLKVLYDNFYLFTAPLNQEYVDSHPKEVKTFIGNQIFRNSDCIVIMVDDGLIDVWNNNKTMQTLILQSLGWDIRINILIIGVSPTSKDVITSIYDSMQRRPWPIFYEQFIMAPSGGLVSIIKKACNLDFKSNFIKYCHRINIALCGSKVLDSNNND